MSAPHPHPHPHPHPDLHLHLRPAQPDDVAAVCALWARAAENAARPADSPTAVVALLERDPAALGLAFVGPDLAGTLVAGWDGWRAHLYRLAVAPEHRRQRVASALLDWAEARLLGLGAIRIDAMVLDDNATGQAIWSARGYHRQPEWSRWVKHRG